MQIIARMVLFPNQPKPREVLFTDHGGYYEASISGERSLFIFKEHGSQGWACQNPYKEHWEVTHSDWCRDIEVELVFADAASKFWFKR